MNTYPDYVRFTSWNSVTYALLSSAMMQKVTGWRQGNFLQYQGRKADGFFFGIANQNGKRHYMFQASGVKSGRLIELAKHDSVKCTRLDLQRTIRKPHKWDARGYYDNLRTDDSNTRKLSIVQSSTGDTLYLGDRNSDSFIRIYEKEVDGLEWLRLEIELKGKTAETAYRKWQDTSDLPLFEKVTFSTIYDTMLNRFRLSEDVLAWFSTGKDDNEQLTLHKEAKDKDNQLRWLLNLSDTIIKMANDHETGHAVREWLTNLIQNLDN